MQNHTMGRRAHAAALAVAALLCLYGTACTGDNPAHSDPSGQKSALDGNTDPSGPDPQGPSGAAANAPTLQSVSSHQATELRALKYLQSESRLVASGGLSSQEIEGLLRSSRNVSNIIDLMTQEAATRPEAQDLTEHYRSSLARAMGQDGVLERLACGLSVCIGIAHARSEADHAKWSSRFENDPSSPAYSYVETSEGVGGGYENRFVFSTDPLLNSISGN